MINYIETAKKEIEIWEKEGPGFLSNVGEIILWPAQKAAETFISDNFFDAVGKAIETIIAGLKSTTNYTINTIEIKARLEETAKSFKERFEAADETAHHYWNWHIAYAAGEGAVLGSGGITSLAADIPVILGMAIRLIQEISICYGFDIETEAEKIYLMHVLMIGSTPDAKSKAEYISALKNIELVVIDSDRGLLDPSAAEEKIKAMALLTNVDKFAENLGIQITKRKALQMVPLLGGLVGGCFNAVFMNDVGRSAFMNYRRRWIESNSN